MQSFIGRGTSVTSPTCRPIPIFVDRSIVIVIVTSQRNIREAVPSDMLQSCFVQCHRLPCCEYFLAALVAYNILVCIKHFQITFCKVGRYFLSSMILAACEAESFLLFFSRFFSCEKIAEEAEGQRICTSTVPMVHGTYQ